MEGNPPNRALFQEVGIHSEGGDRASCQTQRNSFVVNLLDRDISVGNIAERMGFVDPISVERLRFTYENWKNASHQGGPAHPDRMPVKTTGNACRQIRGSFQIAWEGAIIPVIGEDGEALYNLRGILPAM